MDNFTIKISLSSDELEILKIFEKNQKIDDLTFSSELKWQIFEKLFCQYHLIEINKETEFYQLSDFGKQILEQYEKPPSSIYGIIIDCNASLTEASLFWSQALNLEIIDSNENNEHKYALLENINGLHIEIQRVNHDSGVHLDLVCSNLETEIKRMELLGAKLISRNPKGWAIMSAPTGQKFCLILV